MRRLLAVRRDDLFLRFVLFQVIAFMALLWLSRYSSIDIELADFMFDPVTRSFPWRSAWLTETFGHRWLKLVLIIVGSAIVLVSLWDTFRPFAKWSHGFRIRMRVLALSVALIPLLVGGIKQASVLHCPWDIDRYGGLAPYLRLFDALPTGAAPGRCFPAGHATSALWLVAFVVFWLPHQPRKALLVGVLTLTFSFGVGWLQQMRGAHFFSHTLWSMWLACGVVALLYAVFGLWRE